MQADVANGSQTEVEGEYQTSLVFESWSENATDLSSFVFLFTSLSVILGTPLREGFID